MSRVKGLAFRKVDLHVHTPKSMCYSEQSVTPEQITTKNGEQSAPAPCMTKSGIIKQVYLDFTNCAKETIAEDARDKWPVPQFTAASRQRVTVDYLA